LKIECQRLDATPAHSPTHLKYKHNLAELDGIHVAEVKSMLKIAQIIDHITVGEGAEPSSSSGNRIRSQIPLPQFFTIQQLTRSRKLPKSTLRSRGKRFEPPSTPPAPLR
jgi:hypothetical protein